MRVDELVFPADFVILDMDKDSKTPLVLRRPFLATGKAFINVEMGELILRFNNEDVVFNVFYHKENNQCYWIHTVEHEQDKKDYNQIKGDPGDQEKNVVACSYKTPDMMQMYALLISSFVTLYSYLDSVYLESLS